MPTADIVIEYRPTVVYTSDQVTTGRQLAYDIVGARYVHFADGSKQIIGFDRYGTTDDYRKAMLTASALQDSIENGRHPHRFRIFQRQAW